MMVIVSLPCFLFFLVSICLHFEALALPTGTCRCCVSSNGTGKCLNTTTVCFLIGANSSSTTEANHTECYNATCSDVNVSYCVHPEAFVTSAIDHPPSEVVVITCATVVPAIVVILVFIGLLVYCQLRRVKKDPPKMLPSAQDMDESIRSRAAVIIPEDQVTSEHQSRTTGISGAPTSDLRPSHSLRQDKEEWTPRGILKSGPSSTEALKPSSPSSPSYGATDDKSRGRKASNERQQHTYKNVEMDKKVHDYINVAGLVNVDDDGNSPDYIETCPYYVNTPSRNSADDDDLDYENVDVSATTSQIITSPTETSKASMQSKSPPLAPKSKGSIPTASSEGKAVSSDWLASIRGDRVAPMDPDYVDMDAKSKARTMFPFEFNSRGTESTAATFVSAPDVRTMEMKPKPKPVRPHLYENKNPADHRKPKTTTAQVQSTTNL